jgi:hypothetical protein
MEIQDIPRALGTSHLVNGYGYCCTRMLAAHLRRRHRHHSHLLPRFRSSSCIFLCPRTCRHATHMYVYLNTGVSDAL